MCLNEKDNGKHKEELKIMADEYCQTFTAETYEEAINAVSGEEVIFVFGSLYLASSIRENLKIFFK